MGEQRDRDVQWAPEGPDVREQIFAPRPVEAFADAAEGVLQGVGVPRSGRLAAIAAQNSSR